MTTPEDKGCAKRVAARFTSCSRPCSRRGVLLERGAWWCAQHAPSAIAAWTIEQTRTLRVAHAQTAADKADAALLDDVLQTGRVHRGLWAQAVDARRALRRLKGKKA